MNALVNIAAISSIRPITISLSTPLLFPNILTNLATPSATSSLFRLNLSTTNVTLLEKHARPTLDGMNLVTFQFFLVYHFLLCCISKPVYVTVILLFFFSPQRRFVLQTEISGKYITEHVFYFISVSN